MKKIEPRDFLLQRMGILQENCREVSLLTASENGDVSLALKNITVCIGMTYMYQSHMNIYRIYIPIDTVILLNPAAVLLEYPVKALIRCSRKSLK